MKVEKKIARVVILKIIYNLDFNFLSIKNPQKIKSNIFLTHFYPLNLGFQP